MSIAILLLNLRRCICSKTVRLRHHHHNVNAGPISGKTTSIATNPLRRLRFSDDNLFNPQHLSRTILACTDARDHNAALSLHTHLVKFHPHGSISLWNKMLYMFCRCGDIQYSHQVFDEMLQRDVISFNTIISAYIRQEKNTTEALQLYRRMQEENVRPNHITLSALLGGCGCLEGQLLLEQIHVHTIKRGLNYDKFVGSSLVDGYSKCMRLQGATQAFDEIKERDLISWNVLIDACVRNGSQEHALMIFDRMRRENVGFDCFTLTSVIKISLEPRDLGRGMQIHGCAVKVGLASETPIGNALVTMYSKCEQGMKSATQVFSRIQEPNIISWTAMIAGSTQNGLNKKAIKLYREMLRQGQMENEFSFASILPAYASLASLEQGKQVHARLVKSECGLDVSVANSLIDMYVKCGSLEDAELAFSTMDKHDVISWTVMIAGYGQHGMGREALEKFDEMESKGLKQDSITFLGCLSACSHCGLVDDGLRIFKSMIEVHGIKPKKEHYACVVDMLGRAGRLKEAERFIDDMGIGSDVPVWEALLSSCRIHGQMELGERSAKKIVELQPERDGPYVLLSNIYAERGMWEEKRKVRRRLDESGLRKEVGCSWVSMQGSFGALNDEMEIAGNIAAT